MQLSNETLVRKWAKVLDGDEDELIPLAVNPKGHREAGHRVTRRLP